MTRRMTKANQATLARRRWQTRQALPMSAPDFVAWLAVMKASRGWLQKDCAVALGVDPGQITRWRQRGAPGYVGLACAAIVHDLPEWTLGAAP